MSAIATGNWGCGAFHGNPKLKVLIQLMAAAVAGRSMVYFTFGDTNLRDEVAKMYAHLVQHDIDIGKNTDIAVMIMKTSIASYVTHQFNFLVARIYSMLSEYHRESTSSARSDFYRFLYNRSKMKSLSKYFPTKTESSTARTSAGCPKDTLIKSNKDSPVSNKDAENKRYLYSKAREEETAEEEKILNWLVSCDSEDDDNVKTETQRESLRNGETKNNAERANNSRNGDTRANHSVDNVSDANGKQWPTRTIEDKISNSSGDKVNSTNSKEVIIQRPQSTAKKIKSELSLLRDTTELRDNESLKIIEDYLPESRPLRSPTKRTGQRKISEFFQRTL